MTMSIASPARYKVMELQPGGIWPSTDKFKVKITENLKSIQKGQVGTLRTKHGTYRVLNDGDFQMLYGLAQEVDRLRDGIDVIIAAAISVQEHKDDVSIRVLTTAVSALGRSPSLPVRREIQGFNINNIEVDESVAEFNEEDAIDFTNIKRPF